MPRTDIAYVLIALAVIAIATIVVMTSRYRRFERRRARGHRNDKPMRKPFWLS